MKECKVKTISLSIICIALLSFLQCHAQQEGEKRFSLSEEIKFSGIYISPIQKADSSGNNALAVGSLITLRHNSGIGIGYAPYLIASNHSIFMHAVTISYEQYDKKSFNVIAELNHYFFVKNALVPYSSINNEFYGAFTLKTRTIIPIIKTDLGFGRDSTKNYSYNFYALLGGGFSHSFSKSYGNLHLNLTPSLLLNWGTDQSVQHIPGLLLLPNYQLNQKVDADPNDEVDSTKINRTFKIVNTEMAIEGEIEWRNLFFRSELSYFLPINNSMDKTLKKFWQITLGINLK